MEDIQCARKLPEDIKVSGQAIFACWGVWRRQHRRVHNGAGGGGAHGSAHAAHLRDHHLLLDHLLAGALKPLPVLDTD